MSLSDDLPDDVTPLPSPGRPPHAPLRASLRGWGDRRKRTRPERKSITLSADIVRRFTRIAEAQGRGRYEVMNEALAAQLELIEAAL